MRRTIFNLTAGISLGICLIAVGTWWYFNAVYPFPAPIEVHVASVGLSIDAHGLQLHAFEPEGNFSFDYIWLIGIFAVVAWFFRAKAATPAPGKPGVCTACGYNLTGNTSGVCPECGTPVA